MRARVGDLFTVVVASSFNPHPISSNSSASQRGIKQPHQNPSGFSRLNQQLIQPERGERWFTELPASSYHWYPGCIVNLTVTWYIISWKQSSAISFVTPQVNEIILCHQSGIVSPSVTLQTLAHDGGLAAVWGWQGASLYICLRAQGKSPEFGIRYVPYITHLPNTSVCQVLC